MIDYGDRPNGQGLPVDPRLQWLEDAEAELAERFSRLDRLADYTPAEVNLTVIEALISAEGTDEGNQGDQAVFRGAAERPESHDGRVQGAVVGRAPRAGRVGVRGARGDVRAVECVESSESSPVHATDALRVAGGVPYLGTAAVAAPSPVGDGRQQFAGGDT